MNGGLGCFARHICAESATLYHEAIDHAVKYRPVVEAALSVADEVGGTQWCLDRVELNNDIAEVGF